MNFTYELIYSGENTTGYLILKDGNPIILQRGNYPYEGQTVEEAAQLHLSAVIEIGRASCRERV